MTTPIRPLPDAITRWPARLRWLRAADGCVGWLALLLGVQALLPRVSSRTALTFATVLWVGVAMIPRLRLGFRPLSGLTTLLVSRRLIPGDHAWFVHRADADLVLVTARHGLRMVIARPGRDAAEGMSVRRTRVLLVPRGPRISG